MSEKEPSFDNSLGRNKAEHKDGETESLLAMLEKIKTDIKHNNNVASDKDLDDLFRVAYKFATIVEDPNLSTGFDLDKLRDGAKKAMETYAYYKVRAIIDNPKPPGNNLDHAINNINYSLGKVKSSIDNLFSPEEIKVIHRKIVLGRMLYFLKISKTKSEKSSPDYDFAQEAIEAMVEMQKSICFLRQS